MNQSTFSDHENVTKFEERTEFVSQTLRTRTTQPKIATSEKKSEQGFIKKHMAVGIFSLVGIVILSVFVYQVCFMIKSFISFFFQLIYGLISSYLQQFIL